MTDQLFLSIWLDRNGRNDRLRQFATVLRTFPFSQREQPQSTISILAVDDTEPPLLEKPVNGPLDPDDVLPVLGDYSGDDVAYEVESWWDLWTYSENDWKLAPTRVVLSMFGPEFNNGTDPDVAEQEDLRIDFGIDARFLPDPEIPTSGKMIESNIKSLLRLVHELDRTLAIETRQLQTESGGNFAERLQRLLAASAGNGGEPVQ